MNTPTTVTSISILIFLASASAGLAAEGGKTNLACDVAIVGGGAGGLHTAFRLGPQLGNKVCLFEKEDRLGGRVYDVSRDPGGPVFGLGALRIMETQEVVFSLADELGIKYVAAPFNDDLISSRGYRAFDSDAMRALAYPFATAGEETLYNQLRFGPERANAHKYPDFRSYVRAVVGEENYFFLTDVFRFRGDFTYPLSAQGYLSFLDEDWDVCCTPSYPVGGMSEFIRRMEQKAVQAGVRIYKNQPALEINGGPGNSGGYRIVTPQYVATANRLVIAVDAGAFNKVGGDIAAAIQAQPQFQDLIGVKVASIDQWWPTAWWKNAIPGKDTHRAWTTEHCLNFIEIPTAPYAADQLVTRSVYDDSRTCADFWEVTAQRGIPAVEAEIARGLKYLFPGVTIPAPLKTTVQIWPAAWHYLKAGSPFTNSQIASWAIRPLPGKQVSLVGECYNPQRSGWTDGAYKSSINTLNSVFGLNLPGQTATAEGPLPSFGKVTTLPQASRGRRRPRE
jgi:hypothetical protein